MGDQLIQLPMHKVYERNSSLENFFLVKKDTNIWYLFLITTIIKRKEKEVFPL